MRGHGRNDPATRRRPDRALTFAGLAFGVAEGVMIEIRIKDGLIASDELNGTGIPVELPQLQEALR